MKRQTVVFEALTPWHLPAVAWSVLRGQRITYLRALFDAPGPWWFRVLATRGTVRALELKEPLHPRFNPAGDMAAERTEQLYKDHVARHPLIQQMADLFQDERIHLAFKKYLNALLEQHYYYRLLGERLQEALGVPGTFWFVPARGDDGALPAVTGAHLPPWNLPFLRGRLLAERDLALPFQVPWWSRAHGWFLELWDRVRVNAETVLLAVWQGLRGGARVNARRRYAFAVALIAPNREFANTIRGCDMLLDGRRIRKENTLFVPVARISPAQRRMLCERGLHLAEHPCPPSGRLVRQVVWRAGRVFAGGWGAPWWIARVAAYLVRDHGLWSSFLAAYRVDHFISYNDYSFRHIPRNILLQRDGCRTWHYADAVNTFSTFLARDGGLSFRQTIWSYLLYDTYVSWNAVFSRFLGAHPHAIGTFMDVGCLWSEHVRLLKEGAIASSLRADLQRDGWSPAQRLVAVFDSTYMRAGLTDYADGLAFAMGIRRLLDALPDIFVVWKEKKAVAGPSRSHEARALAAAYAQLAQHPRCRFVAPTTCPSELLALCDLAISFPFTSTAMEAIGARVKAIYYDPQAKYRASYYALIPGLVAHGYDALRQRVDELLDDTTDTAYGDYLERHVQGTVDSHLDGRGLTRFRDALCATGGPDSAPDHPQTPFLVHAATW